MISPSNLTWTTWIDFSIMHSSIEERIALVLLLLEVMMLLLEHFLIAESLSILLQLASEGILGTSWVVHNCHRGTI